MQRHFEHDASSLFLEHVESKTLLRRNVQRFIQTSKYILANSIEASKGSVDSFLKYVVKNVISRNKATQWDLDYELAKRIHFEMNSQNKVTPIDNNNTTTP